MIKLLHIVEPDHAFFGEKDYQQLQIIRRMVRDLDMATEVSSVPIMREPDGLAMSRLAMMPCGVHVEAFTRTAIEQQCCSYCQWGWPSACTSIWQLPGSRQLFSWSQGSIAT